MYKAVPPIIKKIDLDTNLYTLHKNGKASVDFGMDNTATLFENGFGLYSTSNINSSIGPIKTQFFRIALTKNGSANFGLGLEKYSTQPNSILFGIPGQIFSLYNFNSDFFAYYMLFTEKFIGDCLLLQSGKQQFPFLTYAGLQSFLLNNDTAGEIESIIHKINDEVKKHSPGNSEMIKLYIQQIILHANRCYGNGLIPSRTIPDARQSIFKAFIKAVSQHFLTVRKVSDYAAMLHVSPDHLNRAIKYCSDKTAHELIDEMLLMEAKSYLLQSSLSVAEIANELAFSDPSHFNRFFKKYCSLTPSEFRNKS